MIIKDPVFFPKLENFSGLIGFNKSEMKPFQATKALFSNVQNFPNLIPVKVIQYKRFLTRDHHFDKNRNTRHPLPKIKNIRAVLMITGISSHCCCVVS